jgi:hypothetical protein
MGKLSQPLRYGLILAQYDSISFNHKVEVAVLHHIFDYFIEFIEFGKWIPSTDSDLIYTVLGGVFD